MTPRLRDRLRRSRYSGPPRPAKLIVAQGTGRVVGYEMADGTTVKAGEPCCEDPRQCRSEECWAPWPPPPKPPWWRR
jgi:hypothetical protein